MARSLSTASPQTQSDAGVNHNGSTDGLVPHDIFNKHKGAYLRHANGEYALAEAAFKAQQKKRKNLLSEAKVDGVRIEQFKHHLKKHFLELESAGKGVEHVAIQDHYDVAGGLKPGEQFSIDFDKIPEGSEKEKVRWDERGYADIYFGAIDPEGHEDADGKKSPFMCFSGQKPSFVPDDMWQSWAMGAARADKVLQEEYLEAQGKKPKTPVEVAASTPPVAEGSEAGKPDSDKENTQPVVEPEKPLTKREQDIAAAKAKAAELPVGATNLADVSTGGNA